ncbi:MAG: recombinase family protein [Rhodobacteraceae bacterium]|nr:recombinase family protein [Paracoccaceae bacterium]
MARTFAYLRVSTPEQTTENQVQKITASGFRVEPHRIVTETISGSVAISQRPEFTRLADRLEPGDVLVVTKLDRLGRNAMDVAALRHPVHIYCSQLLKAPRRTIRRSPDRVTRSMPSFSSRLRGVSHSSGCACNSRITKRMALTVSVKRLCSTGS